MRNKKLILGICNLVMIAGLAFPAWAQVESESNRDIADRMDKLEHDLMVLQRQAARGGSEQESSAIPASDQPPSTANAASVDVQISNLEDEMRKLRGRVEENEFQVRQLSDKMTKFQQDTELRLNEITTAQAAQAAAAAKAPPAPEPKAVESKLHDEKAPTQSIVDTSSEAHEIKEGESAAADEAPAKTTAGNGVLETHSDTETFDSPRDEYNYAFRLLNQTRYDDAARYFEEFIHKYAKDPLIGNAYYWLGETHYIRHDYVKAADSFRQGFEALPSGPKAADNLLKLSMSLSAMNKTKDACVVLDQLSVKFKETSPSVVQKAGSERSRIGCK